ncbi:MAG TPA: ATP-binding protein [Thermoanaerobaculia bacterium]|nr:ATP-binding protein [Thermoanaerobaculia bacterium]
MTNTNGAPREAIPRTFRRDSRLFLSVALLLILFLNFVTLLFFRNATEWGSQQTERRASEILRRISAPAADPADLLDRAALAPDVLFVATYDPSGRLVRAVSRELQAPGTLPTARPSAGRVLLEWRNAPSLLLASSASSSGYAVAALDPGPGAALRSYARSLSVLVPLAGALLVVLAWLYLRSLLAPYERLLRTAGTAPPAPDGEPGAQDEREFLIARFEATIAALSEKERELERLARVEKERADDMEIAARTLARNLPTGLLSVDRSGTVVELNEAGREILSLTRDARGEPYQAALDRVPEFRDVVAAVLEGREAVGRREAHWGEPERVLGVTVTPATGADGRFLGVLALFSDLSEVRRLEGNIARARRLADLGEVSAGAAHEFRNAAAAIDGFADLALRSPERAPEHLRAIRREAQEMSRVTSDFLLFARPDGFPLEPVSLSAVAEAAVDEVRSAFPGSSVALSGEFPEVAGSPVLLRRAVANLLRNAAEATPPARRAEPGALGMEGSRKGAEVSIAVFDRGPGVEPGAREKIFLPFYSSKPEGVGFGLAIVARIAQMHGGTVEVGARPGGGAVFTLRLSAAREPGEPARIAAAPGATRSGS